MRAPRGRHGSCERQAPHCAGHRSATFASLAVTGPQLVLLLGGHRTLETVCREWGRATRDQRKAARIEYERQVEEDLRTEREIEEARRHADTVENDFIESWSIDSDGNWNPAGERRRIAAARLEEEWMRFGRLHQFFSWY